MTISSFNKIIIDTEALRYNYQLLTDLVNTEGEIMAMVKSDGYGHGLESSAHTFARAGCTRFGVAELAEGVGLRDSGCTGQILIFLGFELSSIDYFFSHNLTPVIFSREDLGVLSAVAAKKQQQISIYLKFDCGMSRLGFKPHEAAELVSQIERSDFLLLEGIVCHYPCSDDRTSDNSRDVYRLFSTIVDSVGKEKIGNRSACNSGGALYLPETHGELVRAGISLYGYYPDGRQGRAESTGKKLKPAMSFITRVIQINDVEAGMGISYGHSYRTQRATKLAVLPVGYSDGYPRSVSNKGVVLISGKRAPIRGRVCMNLCMADITGIEGVGVGDDVVLLGSQGNEAIDADEIAGWSNTISYEILCAIGNNNQRITR